MTYASVYLKLTEAIQRGGYDTLAEAFYHFRDKNGNPLQTDDSPLTEEEKKFKPGIIVPDPSGDGDATLLSGKEYDSRRENLLSVLRPLKAVIEQNDGELILEGRDKKQIQMKNVLGNIGSWEMESGEAEQEKQNSAESEDSGPSDPAEVPVSTDALRAAQSQLDKIVKSAGYASLEEAFGYFRDADGKPFAKKGREINEAEAGLDTPITDLDGTIFTNDDPLYNNAKDDYLGNLRPLVNALYSESGDHEISITDSDGKSHSIKQFLNQFVSDYTPQKTAEDVLDSKTAPEPEKPFTDADWLPLSEIKDDLPKRGIVGDMHNEAETEIYVLSKGEDGSVKKTALHDVLEELAAGTKNLERGGRIKEGLDAIVREQRLFIHDKKTDQISCIGPDPENPSRTRAYYMGGPDINVKAPAAPAGWKIALHKFLPFLFRGEVGNYLKAFRKFEADNDLRHDALIFNMDYRNTELDRKAAEEIEKTRREEGPKMKRGVEASSAEIDKLFDKRAGEIEKMKSIPEEKRTAEQKLAIEKFGDGIGKAGSVQDKLAALAKTDPVRIRKQRLLREAADEFTDGGRDQEKARQFENVKSRLGDDDILADAIPGDDVPSMTRTKEFLKTAADFVNTNEPSEKLNEAFTNICKENIRTAHCKFYDLGAGKSANISGATPQLANLRAGAADIGLRAEANRLFAGLAAGKPGPANLDQAGLRTALPLMSDTIKDYCAKCVNMEGTGEIGSYPDFVKDRSHEKIDKIASKNLAANTLLMISSVDYDNTKRGLTAYSRLQGGEMTGEDAQRLAARCVIDNMAKLPGWPKSVDPRIAADDLAKNEKFKSIAGDDPWDIAKKVEDGSLLTDAAQAFGRNDLSQQKEPVGPETQSVQNTVEQSVPSGAVM
jgi:hypothetical protein